MENKMTQHLDALADRAVPAGGVDLWPAIRGRAAASQGSAGHSRRLPVLGRPAAVGLVAVLLAAIMAGAYVLTGGSEPASAEAILDQAQAAAAQQAGQGAITYHLIRRSSSPVKDHATVQQEIWYAGPNRQRMAVTAVDPAGGRRDVLSLVVFNGDEAWIVTTGPDGAPVYVQTRGTDWTRPGESPSSAGTLAEFLQQYAQEKPCVTVQTQGSAMVAGRETYVLKIQPRAQTAACKGPFDQTVWLDKATFLPLKSEVRDGSGAVIARSEATSVQFNVELPDSIFSYAPPAGVKVLQFTGGSGADVKRAIFEAGHPGPLAPNKR